MQSPYEHLYSLALSGQNIPKCLSHDDLMKKAMTIAAWVRQKSLGSGSGSHNF